MKIRISGLCLEFEADNITEGEPLKQAQDYLDQINMTIGGDGSSDRIVGANDLSSSDISVFENCSECEDDVERDDPYFATPCGTFCESCMHDHAEKCGVCAAEFGIGKNADEAEKDRKWKLHQDWRPYSTIFEGVEEVIEAEDAYAAAETRASQRFGDGWVFTRLFDQKYFQLRRGNDCVVVEVIF